MAFAGDEEDDITAAAEKTAAAAQSAAQLRDQLFEENQGTAVKTIGGVVLGLYLIYRFLIK